MNEGYPCGNSPRGACESAEKEMEPVDRRHRESSEPFVEHLLAIPEAGDDADFDRNRSGPRQQDEL